ncbi:uncharacterized protein LOC131943504 [Physella acuta]|uniref:uncharacterized protein LOC131943504 n=1 Tax=Physella acuta TaxID=109671 RepID=UPI0027DC40E2|nr:uncharacterized protein LOC131943504 [Physella acuta]
MSLELKLKEAQYFTWLRLVVKDELKNYAIRFESGTVRHDCRNQSSIKVATKVMDIACDLTIKYVDKVILTWDVRHIICSVYVSGGRNVAPNGETSSTPTMYGLDASIATNGDTEVTSLSLMPNPVRQRVTITFRQPQRIFQMVVYARTDAVQFGLDPGFRIECIGEFGHSLANYTRLARDVRGRMLVTSVVHEPIGRLDVVWETSGDVSRDASLELYEIEAYGDCSSPVYGLYCDEICSMGCVDQLCHYNGQCYHCVEGRTGKHCVGGQGQGNSSHEKEEQIVNNKTEVTPTPPAKKQPGGLFSGSDLFLFVFYFLAMAVLITVVSIFIYLRQVAHQQLRESFDSTVDGDTFKAIHELRVVREKSFGELSEVTEVTGVTESDALSGVSSGGSGSNASPGN